MPSSDHITVCIPTYKRPLLLEQLLKKLQHQVTNGLFTFSIVVVDNDFEESARTTVEKLKRKAVVAIDYYGEPEQSISLARNRAVENAKGSFIGFIDDDEFPSEAWLLRLYETCKQFGSDGVLGPVKPHFEGQPPAWLVRGRFCERESHKTGTMLHWEQTRTGNTLLRRALFTKDGASFDPERGRTGGEDIDFFRKMMETGRSFVWCNEAEVFETVPPERWKKEFYIRKYLQMGGHTGEMAKRWSLLNRCKWLTKGLISISFYGLVLPFSGLAGQHVAMKCLLKEVYYLSWFVGFLWRAPIRFRY